MIAFSIFYAVSGTAFMAAALWIAGDLASGRKIVLTPRVLAIAVLWPAALSWLLGAAALDVVRHLRGR